MEGVQLFYTRQQQFDHQENSYRLKLKAANLTKTTLQHWKKAMKLKYRPGNHDATVFRLRFKKIGNRAIRNQHFFAAQWGVEQVKFVAFFYNYSYMVYINAFNGAG